MAIAQTAAPVRPYDPDPRAALDRATYPEHFMNARFARPALIVTALVALVGLTWTGASAVARMSAAAPPTNPVIATINIEVILPQLAELKDRSDAVKSARAEARARAENYDEQAKAVASRLEELPAGPDKDKARKELRDLVNRAKFELDVVAKDLDVMEGDVFRDLFVKTTDTTQRHAKKNGYALVLSPDAGFDIPEGGNRMVSAAISAKRVIYVDPSLDISADIVAIMNNEYAASRKTP